MHVFTCATLNVTGAASDERGTAIVCDATKPDAGQTLIIYVNGAIRDLVLIVAGTDGVYTCGTGESKSIWQKHSNARTSELQSEDRHQGIGKLLWELSGGAPEGDAAFTEGFRRTMNPNNSSSIYPELDLGSIGMRDEHWTRCVAILSERNVAMRTAKERRNVFGAVMLWFLYCRAAEEIHWSKLSGDRQHLRRLHVFQADQDGSGRSTVQKLKEYFDAEGLTNEWKRSLPPVKKKGTARAGQADNESCPPPTRSD